MSDYLKKCKECLLTWNAPATAGWLSKALQEERRSEEIELQILAWEKKLIRLLKSQRTAVGLQT